jgi:hypothetical protein
VSARTGPTHLTRRAARARRAPKRSARSVGQFVAAARELDLEAQGVFPDEIAAACVGLAAAHEDAVAAGLVEAFAGFVDLREVARGEGEGDALSLAGLERKAGRYVSRKSFGEASALNEWRRASGPLCTA